jgi:type I restriction enzyme S subunit
LELVEENLKRYRASVRKAAVEGRLVPTEAELARREGRDYEPASQLLERILNERQTHASSRKPRTSPGTEGDVELPELPEGWCWTSIGQLAADEPYSLTDGPFGSNLKTAHYTEAGPRVVRLQNIADGTFVDEEAHISEGHYATLKKHAVHAGDIVIASLGENLPKACLVPDWLGPAVVKADCLRLKPDPHLVDSRYLLCALNSEPLRARTGALIHGLGRPRIGLTLLRALKVPLPPRAEQDRIAREVEAGASIAAAVSDQLVTQVTKCAALRQSILKWAFAGKLVEQDSNDEPATVLLERIKAQRTQVGRRVR